MTYWKVYCMENQWPGLWRRYYQHQVAAVGFPMEWGYKLEGKSKSAGWSRVRNALKAVEIGDKVVVQLNHNRVGRIGEVIRKEVGDKEWTPLVPRSKQYPHGAICASRNASSKLANFSVCLPTPLVRNISLATKFTFLPPHASVHFLTLNGIRGRRDVHRRA